jgi:uncharacterized membrane protein
MDFSILIYVLISMLPIAELRIGLPLAINYALENNLPIFLMFILIVLSNIFVIFIIFYFLDNLHKILLKNNFYKKTFDKLLNKVQKKVDKFENKYSTLGFLALIIFVAVPLPGTGAWTGCLISWLLGLDKKKSIMSIATGVLISGLIILLMTLGFFILF